MSAGKFRLSSALALLAVVLAPRVVHAEGNSALAESLFQEGKRLSAAGQYADACPKFAASYKIDAATGTLLNLAACEQALGQTASAWAHFTDAATFSKRDGNQARADYATQQIAILEAKLIRLIVTVPPEANVPGLAVKLDGQILLPAAYGVAAPIDPGAHTIEASAPGKKPLHFEIKADTPHTTLEAKIKWDGSPAPPTVSPGSAAPPAAGAPSAAPAAAPGSPAAAVSPGSPGSPSAPASPPAAALGSANPSAPGSDAIPGAGSWIGYALGGVGLAGIGAGIVFHFSAVSENDAALEACTQGDGTVCADETDRQNHDKHLSTAKSNRTISYVGLGVGSAALAAGVVYLLLAPSSGAPRTASVMPLVERDSLGVGYARAW